VSNAAAGVAGLVLLETTAATTAAIATRLVATATATTAIRVTTLAAVAGNVAHFTALKIALVS
jgi:hypothetical protein